MPQQAPPKVLREWAVKVRLPQLGIATHPIGTVTVHAFDRADARRQAKAAMRMLEYELEPGRRL